jgi:hypothetical protein
MVETMTIYKASAVGLSTVRPNVVMAKACQLGMHRMHFAWLEYLLANRGPQLCLPARAVRFALEHWHA